MAQAITVGAQARYVLLGLLGTGASGRVYAALDTQLGRKVAIKLLRSQPGTNANAVRARVIHEAHTLARLPHPNVVAVHDVGVLPRDVDGIEDPSGVFLVMELVEGISLAQWMAGERRDWRDVVAIFHAIARGLAAAHREGVVHRDVKPANVIVGSDGRPRVVDFGLARVDAADDATGSSLHDDDDEGDALDRTSQDTLVGTPLYMAPEQHRGEPADAAADQYALCTAMYEALYGRTPFRAKDLDELSALKQRGKLLRPQDTAVPRWLHRVIARGLHPSARRRFRGMEGLIAALERGQKGRGGRWRFAAVAGLAAVALSAVVAAWG
jgi:serine/threonine protein kinase